MYLPTTHAARQPPSYFKVRPRFEAGLVELYCQFTSAVPTNLVGDSRFASVANAYTRSVAAGSLVGPVQGGGYTSVSNAGMYKYDITKIAADLTATGRVTHLAVVRSAAQDGGGDGGPISMRGDYGAGSANHYPYTDGKIYLSDYCENRWVSAVTPPVTLTEPHAIVVSARAGEQQCYMAGRLIASGARAEAPMMYAGGNYGYGANGAIYLLARWNRILSEQDKAALSLNPWQIFESPRIFIPFNVAAAGVPALSASTYVPGSLTSTGWRPQVTAT